MDVAAVLKNKIQPAFAKVGIIGVGWHDLDGRWTQVTDPTGTYSCAFDTLGAACGRTNTQYIFLGSKFLTAL